MGATDIEVELSVLGGIVVVLVVGGAVVDFNVGDCESIAIAAADGEEAGLFGFRGVGRWVNTVPLIVTVNKN